MPAECNLHLIRAFSGPRHARLEAIWRRVGALCPNAAIYIHDNLSQGAARAPLQHGQMLQAIWEEEKARPEATCIFTEFDFLPSILGLTGAIAGANRERPIWAAEYATRDPYSRRLRRWEIPGAWFVRVNKRHPVMRAGLDSQRGGLHRLDFTAGGPANDPAANLPPALTHLLGAEEGTLSPFGVRVPGPGQLLFWSRHYNDPPGRRVAGFVLGEIQRAVDTACDKYEDELGRLEQERRPVLP